MRKQRAERLRFAVNTLPPETQRAMLDGINENRIVTGANSDHRGGLCPMLAADRNAFQVTPLAEIFATAWDKYTGTSFVNVTRRTACDRDLNVLRSMLETSLGGAAGAATDGPVGHVSTAALAELADNHEALTEAARLEIVRGLEGSGRHARAATLPSPRPAAWLAAEAPAARAAEPGRRIAARSGRGPTNRTESELERERARQIVANQASTLRKRSWPRQSEPVADLAPALAVAAPAPAPVPVPVAVTPAPRRELHELAAQSGWTWLRPFSSYEDYERTLTDLGETQRGPGVDDGGVNRDDTKSREPART